MKILLSKYLIRLIIPTIVIGVGFFVGFAFITSAQESTITYPVAELGDCANKDECKVYCDDAEHITECIAFAEANNLINREEASKARRLSDIGEGPGGCTTKESCKNYCEDISNIDECLDFAERTGIMPDKELKEARQISKALKDGARLPGGCRGKVQCEAYCNNPDNIDECLDFAERASLIPKEELAEARKVARAFKAGHRPPGNCKDKAECEAYCEEASNINECLDFAGRAGLIPPEELAQARKIAPLIASGRMPGGCKSRTQCETYCSEEGNSQECIAAFAEAGIISPNEAELLRKTGGRGPGGCKGRDECEAFCNDVSNQEICFGFAREHGLIDEEQLQHIEVGIGRLKESFNSAPLEVSQCLKDKVGLNIINRIQSGDLLPGADIGDLVRKCFEENFQPPGEARGLDGDQRKLLERPENFDELPLEVQEQFQNKRQDIINDRRDEIGDGIINEGRTREDIPAELREEFDIRRDRQQVLPGDFDRRSFDGIQDSSGKFQQFSPPEDFKQSPESFDSPPDSGGFLKDAGGFLLRSLNDFLF